MRGWILSLLSPAALQFTTCDPSAGLVFNTALLDYYPISICFDDVRLTKN
jgi:hypothetical protein